MNGFIIPERVMIPLVRPSREMRWPHTLPPRLSPVMQLVVEDYVATQPNELTVKHGDTVHLLSKKENRCLVQKLQPLCKPLEGWVPSYVIGQGVRKNRSFRLRKLGFSMERLDPKPEKEKIKEDRSYSIANPITPTVYESTSLKTGNKLCSLSVFEGDTAEFFLNAADTTPVIATWTLPSGSIIILDVNEESYEKDRIEITKTKDGRHRLRITQCTLYDSGKYSCKVESLDGSLSDSAELTILDKFASPGCPSIIEQGDDYVCLQWSPPLSDNYSCQITYNVQFSVDGGELWQNYEPTSSVCSQTIQDLQKGQAYSFRVCCTSNTGHGDPGPYTDPIIIPFSDQTSSIPGVVCWKEGFRKDYSEIAELGRGRFAIVKSCTAKHALVKHKAVAAKLINKGRSGVFNVEKEYLLLNSLQNSQIPQALDIYDSPHHYVLILELVAGPNLLEFLCTEPTYDEGQVIPYIRQLLQAINYLHSLVVVHLDIKPENLLVDCGQSPPLLQLVDFGDASRLQPKPFVHSLLGNPEFSAPEIIRGHPVSLGTDIWSVGVLLYVLLCGISPFYEKGIVETCINIDRVEFTFPEELFSHVNSEARNLINQILQEDPCKRPSCGDIENNQWLSKDWSKKDFCLLSSSRLTSLMERRRLEQQNIRNIQVT